MIRYLKKYRNQNLDVMIGVWSSHGRDFEALYPVYWYLKNKLGLSVAFSHIFDPWLLDYLKPRLILSSGSIGAPECLEFVKAAKRRNIPTVSLFAEGNIKEKYHEQMVWGWNREKILYEDITLPWSERARDIILEHYPELKDRLIVAGGQGFDRYRIYKFMSREKLKEKYERKEKNIAGYATWGFDRLDDPKFIAVQKPVFGKEGIERLKKDRDGIREILKRSIEKNPDTLFLLKLHPGTVGENHEVRGLEKYPNTLILKNEEPIADIINACDLWMAFESTTCLEAWLLEKNTILINPSGPDFPRDNLHKGSVIAENYEELQKHFDEYFDHGIISEFQDKTAEREQAIKEVIQWSDGFNHVRTARIIDEMLRKKTDEYERPSVLEYLKSFFVHLWVEAARIFPNLYPVSWKAYVHRFFREEQFEKYGRRYGPQLEKFHDKYQERAKAASYL